MDRMALLPLPRSIIYGSIAKQESTTAESDIDLMLISDKLTYADIYPLLENTRIQLCRPINPTIYSASEWTRKVIEKNNFLTRVLSQPKIFLIGNEHDLSEFHEISNAKI